MSRVLALLLLLATPVLAGEARADIIIGAILSLTGPAATLGIPARNTIELLPAAIAGQPVRFVVLDDASDPAAAVRAARKLIETEHADILFGPSNSPNSLAVLEVAAASGTPMITLAGCTPCIEPQTGPRRWAFKMPPNDALIMDILTARMNAMGVRSLATFAFANAFGDAFAGAMDASATAAGITPTLTVRYNPADASVTPQALRLLATHPDAVFIAASGTPATTPALELRARGYAGPLFSNPGAASADLLRVGGRAVEGMLLSVCPFMVAEQLDDANPVKPAALAYDQAYEARFGPNTRAQAGAQMWDAFALAAAAASTLTLAPGTPEYRAALRQSLEHAHGVVGAQGVFEMTPANHNGADARSIVLVDVHDGAWRLVR